MTDFENLDHGKADRLRAKRLKLMKEKQMQFEESQKPPKTDYALEKQLVREKHALKRQIEQERRELEDAIQSHQRAEVEYLNQQQAEATAAAVTTAAAIGVGAIGAVCAGLFGLLGAGAKALEKSNYDYMKKEWHWNTRTGRGIKSRRGQGRKRR